MYIKLKCLGQSGGYNEILLYGMDTVKATICLITLLGFNKKNSSSLFTVYCEWNINNDSSNIVVVVVGEIKKN